MESLGLFVTDISECKGSITVFFFYCLSDGYIELFMCLCLCVTVFVCWLTRGQEPQWQPDPQTAAAAECSRSPPCADLSFPCEPAGGS